MRGWGEGSRGVQRENEERKKKKKERKGTQIKAKEGRKERGKREF